MVVFVKEEFKSGSSVFLKEGIRVVKKCHKIKCVNSPKASKPWFIVDDVYSISMGKSELLIFEAGFNSCKEFLKFWSSEFKQNSYVFECDMFLLVFDDIRRF